MRRHESEIAKMLRTNVRQKRYYESKKLHFERGGTTTRLWGRARQAMAHMRSRSGIEEDVLRLHLEWLGDLSDKKVLDLGCSVGNRLSMHLARASRSYLGIDLNERAIGQLNRDLREASLHSSDARAEAVDFLSPDFDESGFDVVYAQIVLHHFEHTEVTMKVIRERRAPGSTVVTRHPLQTSSPRGERRSGPSGYFRLPRLAPSCLCI